MDPSMNPNRLWSHKYGRSCAFHKRKLSLLNLTVSKWVGEGSKKLGDRTIEIGEEEVSAMETLGFDVGSWGCETYEALDTMIK